MEGEGLTAGPEREFCAVTGNAQQRKESGYSALHGESGKDPHSMPRVAWHREYVIG